MIEYSNFPISHLVHPASRLHTKPGDHQIHLFNSDHSFHLPLFTMPPPAIAKAEARLKAQKIGGARHSTSPNKVVDRVQKPMPKQQPRIDFLKFPAEIQHMIWAEYFQKPACHTFKFVFQEAYAVPFHRWGMELQPLPDNYDPSAYKRWKRFIWKSHWRLRSWPRANDKPMSRDQHFLANTSFQTGFRRAMIDFQTLEVLVSTRGIRRDSAAIDAATDLTILEFDRGVNAKALHWFEHSTGTMYMNSIRRHMRPLERVAVHYKRSHKNATSRGPFQCYCRSGSDLDCGLYKACPMEQACFLDCFPKLKEFYYVVEVTKKKELAWKDDYKGQLSFPPPG